MTRRGFIGLLGLLPCLCQAQIEPKAILRIDWKATVCKNLLTDLEQTRRFRQTSAMELNPIYSRVGSKELPAVFIGMSLWAWEKLKDDEDAMKWWGIAQAVTVFSNRRFAGFGFPVVSIKF